MTFRDLLVVSPHLKNKSAIRNCILQTGLGVISASDTENAMRIAQDPFKKVSGVVVDMNAHDDLGELDLIDCLRQEEKTKRIKILLMTDFVDMQLIDKIKSLRVNDCYIKPMEHLLLVSRIEKLFCKQQKSIRNIC